MSTVSVTVTGAGSLFGQGVIKCLARSGLDVELHGLDYFATAVGLRWCRSGGLLPDILDSSVSEDRWFEALCERIVATKSRFAFVGTDFELAPIAARRDALLEHTGCTAIVSAKEIVALCRDKYATAEWLREEGLPAPVTVLPGEGPDAIERDLGYPMIVKPRFGSRSRGVVRVEARPGLERALAETDRPLVQQYLPGEDREFTCGVIVLDGRVDSVSVLRRRLKDGNTVLAAAEHHPAIDSLCRRVAGALKPFGPINLQLRLVDGTPYVFEINPRFSGTTVFRALLGINEPDRMLRHLLGMPLAPAAGLRSGRVMRYFEEMVEPEGAAETPPPAAGAAP